VGPFAFTPDTLKFDPDLWIASTHNTVTFDASIADPLFIFPNPTNDAIQVSYHGVDPITEIFIFDLSGKKMKDMFAANTAFFDPLTLDVSNLSAGFYFLEIKTTSSDKIVKFVKR
jgi:hypothetical protein